MPRWWSLEQSLNEVTKVETGAIPSGSEATSDDDHQ
jgi:hypothetical protein